LNHDYSRELGSTKTNLQLFEDNIGLRAIAEITDAEVIEKAKKGELRGWSFGFIERAAKEEDTDSGLKRRFVEDIPDTYQSGAVWIMNKATRTAIRKLKDSDGNYLLNRDVSARWGYTLLGKDVYCSDAMPKMAAKATAVYYGDFSGLAVKVAEDANIEVLREKYATQHAVGVVAWMEIDTKVEDSQKIAKLTMA